MENTRDVRCGIKSALDFSGSTWTTLEELNEALKREKLSISGLDQYIRNGEVIYYCDAVAGDLFTLPGVRATEMRIAQNVIRIKKAPSKRGFLSESEAADLIAKISQETGITLCAEQKDAVKKALRYQIMVLTGGPGTGKTCTLNTIIKSLRACGFNDICCAAPTGKAARRMSESTGMKAETLHRVINITKEKKTPRILSCDVIIVDEISMLDTEVADAFFRAVPSGVKVILVGDTDQLPSVGKGAVLRDLLASEVVPSTRLVKTYRQGNESLIFVNMKKIRCGDYDLEVGDDFKIAVPTRQFSAVDEIIAIYMSEYRRLGGNDDLCLLTPFRNRKYETSSEALNLKLQRMINSKSRGLEGTDGLVYRAGDPVMQMKNREECANGDVGRVVDVSDSSILVHYDGVDVTYSADELSQLSLAYAMSIHKSQGSEYKSVITTLLCEHGPMLQRNLLYTAVTRAKKNCFLVCEPDAVKQAVETVADVKRVTKLAECLKRENFVQNMR